MANEVRRRNDNVFGTLSSTMNSTGTTLNSAGLANLEAISSTEHAVIVIDPNRTAGAPEHVKVTAHTGSATSATIVRGQFGTSARAHSSTEDWVHAPIASNATSFASAANLQGDFVPMGEWEDWTPTLSNITQGSGTVVAKFLRVGRTIFWRFQFTMGAGSAMGTSPSITPPVTPASDYVSNRDPIGVAEIADAGTANFGGRVSFVSGNIAFAVWGVGATYPTVAAITASVPMTWTTNDVLSGSGMYEAAS